MIQQQKKPAHTGGMAWYLIFAAIYIGLLIYFGYQTWEFVNWLFPGDALAMKMLAMLCFDILAFGWACLDTFYHFADSGTRTCIRWAWGISFILSLLASILYLVISNMLRFNIPLNQNVIDLGEGIVIFALTLNILFLTAFLYREWNDRHPHQDGIYSLPQAANIPQTQVQQIYSQEDLKEAITGAFAALLLPEKNTDPLAAAQAQNSIGAGQKKNQSAHKAASVAGGSQKQNGKP